MNEKLDRMERLNMNCRWLSELAECGQMSVFCWLQGYPATLKAKERIETALDDFERELVRKRRFLLALKLDYVRHLIEHEHD